VADTVEALVQLGSSRSHSGETFNISTGIDISVAAVIDLVGELVGREFEVRTDERRLRPERSEVFQLLGNSAKLRAAYGWEPRTSLRDGIQAVIEWMESRSTVDVEPRAV
jgi:nucleoside-diphosphate-sugar epimerase